MAPEGSVFVALAVSAAVRIFSFPRADQEAIWGSGGGDPVEALHRYGQVCLYDLANTGPTAEPD